VAGTRSDLQPSKDTVRNSRNMIPGVRGRASGPARTSNSRFTGAIPTRRRRSRNPFPDGHGMPGARSPAVSFPQDPR
jgi:hypothetical protein